MFSGCTVLPDSKGIDIGSSNQEVSPSTCKNTGVVLVLHNAWKCAHTAISSGMDISVVPGCHLLRRMCSHSGSQKLLQGLVSHELTACLSVFDLLFTQWSYYQKDAKQITLNHTTL